MGKNSGWFRRLFAGKMSKNLPAAESYGGSDSKQSKSKKKWRILGSGSAGEVTATPEKEVETRVSWTEPPAGQSDYQTDASKHAIAVAAAAAAVAEAAVAAAHAAAEVVVLTNRGGRRLDVAAVIIQSAFRGYLAKRALKALKALVKLQALVRGHIVRKQTADMLRRMQALARVQARARASRARAILDSSHSTRRLSQPHHMRWGSNPNISDIKTQPDSSWLEQWMEECSWINNKIRRDSSLQTGYSHHHEDEITHKILEVDSWKPQESMSGRVQSSLSLLRFPFESETVYTADNSPQVCPSLTRPGSSSSSRRRSTTTTTATANALTPRSTDCSTNFFSDHPKYMKKTESSQAKTRSQSAPRMRLQFQKQASSKRSFHGCWDPSSSPNKSIVKNGRPASTLDKVGNSTRFR